VPVAGATVKNCENHCVINEQFLPQRSKKHASPLGEESFLRATSEGNGTKARVLVLRAMLEAFCQIAISEKWVQPQVLLRKIAAVPIFKHTF